MAVPSGPTLEVIITPSSGSGTPIDVSKYMAWAGANNQHTITQNFGRQGTTATIVLIDDYGAAEPSLGKQHFTVPPLSLITVTDTNSALANTPSQGVIFAGVITDPRWQFTSPGRVEWLLQCVDFTFYADHAVPPKEQYLNKYMGEIIVEITNAANCGITAALESDGGHVAKGPLIPIANLTYDTLSNQWQRIATLSSTAANYGWFVDKDRQLHFYDQNNAPYSGVTVTDQPSATADHVSTCHITADTQMYYEWDATSLTTRAIVEGADITYTANKTGPPTDQWVGDGVTRSWPLSYTASGSAGVLTVGGVVQKVTALSIASTHRTVQGQAKGVTTPYVMQQNANGQWFLTVNTGSTPAPGVKIEYWYTYKAPVIAHADLPTEEAAFPNPNGGIFAQFKNDATLTTVAMAYNAALALLQEYGYPVERFVFNTGVDWVGWFSSGQTFKLKTAWIPNYATGMTTAIGEAYYFIVSMQTTITNGGYRTNLVTAERVDSITSIKGVGGAGV